MKKAQQKEELYQRFLNNEVTAAELDELLNFFEMGDEDQLRGMIANVLLHFPEPEAPNVVQQQHLNALHAGIAARIDGQIPVVAMRPWYGQLLFKAAASFIIFVFIGFLTYNYFEKSDQGENIQPACNCASLVTSSGQEIKLEDEKAGEVLARSGVKVKKTAEGQLVYTADPAITGSAAVMNTLVTPLGGKYKVLLSDGTSVTLNSGSSLEFPVGFHGTERRVKLSGEAYFEVSKDPSKPFIVQSGAATTRVLGTKFNVSNYPDEPVQRTTLLEGKVQFSGNGESALLQPGEQASLHKGRLQVAEVNTEDAMAWKDGLFIYKNEELSVIMRQLSRWYDVDVDYSTIPDRRLYVRINRDVNLSEVLGQFALTSNLKFKVEGRRVSFVK
ncbi:FecR family protein [Pedobacter sp. GR22-6]|uniref:FecR family protein n=1 Tax=Pedobacter sp. GR22-6 TaxID=3127957 RepID=UPI00307E2C50